MDYRDILGLPKKQPKKKVEKKVTPKPTAPPITDLLKEEFGDTINEGPAYEYDKYLSAIEKNYKNYWKSVTNFADVLHNKGFQKEAKVVERAYIKNVKVGFKLFLEKVVRKLM